MKSKPDKCILFLFGMGISYMFAMWISLFMNNDFLWTVFVILLLLTELLMVILWMQK